MRNEKDKEKTERETNMSVLATRAERDIKDSLSSPGKWTPGKKQAVQFVALLETA